MQAVEIPELAGIESWEADLLEGEGGKANHQAEVSAGHSTTWADHLDRGMGALVYLDHPEL